MADRRMIRAAIASEIDDLEMAATLRRCYDEVAGEVVTARERMKDGNEPEALKALWSGIWKLAQNDPWRRS